MLISIINHHNKDAKQTVITDTTSINVSISQAEQQGVSAWISWLKAIRLEDMLRKMCDIDYRRSEAMAELEALSRSVEELIASNRGGEKGMHGFIGERAQVYLSNAWSIIKGNVKISELIDDNGMTDYLENGVPIQQKACRSGGMLGIDHMLKHNEKYPEFTGKYQMPKDFFEIFEKISKMSQEEAGKLSRHEWNLWNEIQCAKQQNIEIEPMMVAYSEIQRDTIRDTIKQNKQKIQTESVSQRDTVISEHRPSLDEGIKVTAFSALTEGTLSGATKIIEKHCDGKHIKDYTRQDIEEVGVEALKGTGKGAVRGAVIYVAENFTPIPGPIAGSMVTIAIDSTKAINKYTNGELSKNDCIKIIEKTACTTAFGTLGAKIGGKLCPIPCVGEVIGGFVFTFLVDKGYRFFVKYAGSGCDVAEPKAA